MSRLRLSLLALLVAACASPSPSVSTLQEAAAQGEARFGVPAALTLAVAWTETRWQMPEGDHDAHAHMPAQVGVGGLRPWIAPMDALAADLGVSPETLEEDPALSLLATAALLRRLADARGVDSLEPGDWHEVLADYAGLEGEDVRESYASDVFAWMRRGVSATGPGGDEVLLRSSEVALPDGVSAVRAYSHAEYPGARWVAAHSSNYSNRTASIDRIIIHTTHGSYAGAISWFQNPSANVSAHYVIRSSDGAITQMVHERDKGWHVGNWNSRSIGIEHEGYVADPGRWYTDAMYRSSAALVRHLCGKYGIPMDRAHIVGHSEAPGATHTDPGSGWNWSRFMDLVRGVPEAPPFAASAGAQDAPAEMVSGERAVAWVEYRNDGSREWSLDRTRLGTSSPQDHASPFFDVENWINDHRATPPDHSGYGHGDVGRFTFMITAPEVGEETVVTDTFRLVQEGTTWFGDEVTLSVRVRPSTPPEPPAPADEDGDGSPADADCDDADPSRYPGASDVCGDGIDSDCDGVDPVCMEPPATEPPRFEPPGEPVDVERPTELHGSCSVGAGASSATSPILLLLGLLPLLRRLQGLRVSQT